MPIFSYRYLSRLLDFSKRARPGINVSEMPHLVIIHNFCSDNDTKEYDVKTSTDQFQALLMQTDNLGKMENSFASLSFVKIPDTNKNPLLYSDQIARLQVCTPH